MKLEIFDCSSISPKEMLDEELKKQHSSVPPNQSLSSQHGETMYLKKRQTMLNSLKRLSNKLGFTQRTFYHAVFLADKILLKYTNERVDLTMCTCLLIAAKFNENNPKIPLLSSFQLLESLSYYYEKDIINHETRCLWNLDYSITNFTSFHFLSFFFGFGIIFDDEVKEVTPSLPFLLKHTNNIFVKIGSKEASNSNGKVLTVNNKVAKTEVNSSKLTKNLHRTLVEQMWHYAQECLYGIIEETKSLNYTSFHIALTVIAITRMFYRFKPWHIALSAAYNITADEFKECYNDFNSLFLKKDVTVFNIGIGNTTNKNGAVGSPSHAKPNSSIQTPNQILKSSVFNIEEKKIMEDFIKRSVDEMKKSNILRKNILADQFNVESFKTNTNITEYIKKLKSLGDHTNLPKDKSILKIINNAGAIQHSVEKLKRSIYNETILSQVNTHSCVYKPTNKVEEEIEEEKVNCSKKGNRNSISSMIESEKAGDSLSRVNSFRGGLKIVPRIAPDKSFLVDKKLQDSYLLYNVVKKKMVLGGKKNG